MTQRRNHEKTILSLACAALLTLSACGGGGSSSGPSTSTSDIRELPGMSAPVEISAAQNARAPGMLARADSLVLSSLYGNTNHPDIPTFRAASRCSGTTCTVSDASTGYRSTIRLSDFEFAAGSTVALGTKHGISLMSGTGSLQGTDFTGLGAWMQHAAFAMQTQSGTVSGVNVTVRYGQAGGDLTGVKPTGGATWLGLMAGTPATGSSRGDRLVGTAALNYDIALDTLDVAFSSIVNIDRGRDHSVTLVRFEDLEIGTGGTFQAGASGNRIQGGLYGPGHAEAAGIFEQSNIVGAFGAMRSAQ